MEPRGASPSENPTEMQANVCERKQQLSSIATALQTDIALEPSKTSKTYRQRHRPTSVSTVHLDGNVRRRRIVVNDKERKTFARVTIPLTVCFLEPQQPSSADNPASSGCPTRRESSSDLLVFPSKAPAILVPSNDGVTDQRGLDLVLAPEMLVRCRFQCAQ